MLHVCRWRYLRIQDGLDLRCHHRQHLNVDAVELVEAAPATSLQHQMIRFLNFEAYTLYYLRQSLEDVCHRLIVHLVRAVEYLR